MKFTKFMEQLNTKDKNNKGLKMVQNEIYKWDHCLTPLPPVT